MATEVRLYPVTIPPGTLQAAPLVSQMRFPPRVVDEIEIQVPPGPRGEVGFRIGSSGTQILPYDLGGWIVTDSEVIHWPMESQHDSGSWEFTAYNTGLFSHTITVRFLVSLAVGPRPGAATPIAAGQLQAGDLGLELAGPGALPPLPLLTLPPPPALPPLPQLPPIPTTLGGPGPAPAARQPTYTWWSTDMGRLLTYPDQSTTTRFDEVFLLPDGSVGWYAWVGGAGQWLSYPDQAGSLGGQFVDVSAAFTMFQGEIRLNIVGTAADGTRSLRVMDPKTFGAITAWQVQPPGQSRELAFRKRAGLA